MTKSTPAATFWRRCSMSRSQVAALLVAFRIAGAGEAEAIAALADEADQLAGVAEAVGRAHEGGLALRRIAAQRQHVVDPAVAQPVEDGGDLVAVVPDAGEVRHRLDAVLALDPGDDVDGLLARAAAGAVGHRDEARRQIAQLGDGAHQRLLARLGLGRKELEREHRFAPAEQVADPHNPRNLRESVRQGQ